ncbi:hypothetical protein QYE76_066965 [Lolium multiflorum]|uniref:Uncharacterized protein n=1 Tax=Lolium multiflorum TaxID=4521 RepID=A0AAD8WB92_LOLMU|nr:hypothetical protein QYE76_066965 [Lolium multiflorum]
MEAWPPLAVEHLIMSVHEFGHEEVAGQPSLCVVRRTAAMCDLERRLKFAMVASVEGRRPAVSCEEVTVALRWRGVPEGTVSVHVFAPEDFLVVFESEELRVHVAGMPPVLVAGAPLSFRPWNHQAQATLVPLKSKVSLVIEGIPPHAWDIAVVEDLLGKSCAVDEVAPETKARTDLSLFKLSAWTSECEAIPVARMLAVTEPVLGGGVRSALARSVVAGARGAGQASGDMNTLQYRILIHIARVEDELGVGLERALDPSGRGSAGQRELGDGSGDGGGGSSGDAPRRACANQEMQLQIATIEPEDGDHHGQEHGTPTPIPSPTPSPDGALHLRHLNIVAACVGGLEETEEITNFVAKEKEDSTQMNGGAGHYVPDTFDDSTPVDEDGGGRHYVPDTFDDSVPEDEDSGGREYVPDTFDDSMPVEEDSMSEEDPVGSLGWVLLICLEYLEHNFMASSTSAGCASTRKAAAASRESKSRVPATAPATAVTSPKTTASRRYVRIHTTIVLLLAGGVAIGMLVV